MKKIAIIGSTGSIGTQTLEVVRSHPDRFRIIGLSNHHNTRLLAKQVKEFKPKVQAIFTKDGPQGNIKVATHPDVDLVVIACVGFAGLEPTIAALSAGKHVALANKEVLVVAGQVVTDLARRKKVKILPVDSEHSAIFQCLNGEDKKTIAKIFLTCSGGPFRGRTKKELEKVTVKEALNHPKWKMGPKITIDSATLMNKGFEVLEARWFFQTDLDKIHVVVHPQSIIHSLVEFVDGNIMAQIGDHDMKFPIQYALSYPERWSNQFPKLDLSKVEALTFTVPDTKTFPCLKIAYEAGRQGGTMPAVLNAANEVAVSLFLEGKIKFLQIPLIIKRCLENHRLIKYPSLKTIFQADKWAREFATKSYRSLHSN